MVFKFLLVLFSVCLLKAMAASPSKSEKAGTAAGIAQSCYAAFVENIPPAFCYKKGGDWGKIPTNCPSGAHRYLALCYDNCPGYDFVLGVCWQRCSSGYSNHGLTCYKNLFRWYFKRSYIPKIYTNFASQVKCDSGMYKVGALCYRDCGKIGLKNCGIGACAGSSASCATTIITMGLDFLMSLAKTITFVASFGTSSGASTGISAAQNSVKSGFQKIGKGAIKEGLNCLKNVIKNQGKKEFIKQMTKLAREKMKTFVKDYVKDLVQDTVISTICEEVGNKLISKIDNAKDVGLSFQSFDITGVSGAVEACKTTTTSNDKINCAKSVLQAIDFVDPTGIAGMAASVMQPVCNGV